VAAVVPPWPPPPCRAGTPPLRPGGGDGDGDSTTTGDGDGGVLPVSARTTGNNHHHFRRRRRRPAAAALDADVNVGIVDN